MAALQREQSLLGGFDDLGSRPISEATRLPANRARSEAIAADVSSFEDFSQVLRAPNCHLLVAVEGVFALQIGA